MFGHLPELIIILVLALIVFGPEKLPEAAANAGRMVREMREVMDSALNPQDVEVPDDFSTYYYESLARSGEDVPEMDEEFSMYEDVDGHPEEEPEGHEMAEGGNVESAGSRPVAHQGDRENTTAE